MRIPSVEENYVEFKRRRVGLEFENPLTDANGGVIREDVIQPIHARLKQMGWEGEPEPLSGNILSVDKKFNGRNANVSTDCGWSTVEMAMPPQDSLHDAKDLFDTVLREVLDALSGQSVRLLAIGMIPGRASADEAYKTTKPINRAKAKLKMHNIFVPLNAHQVGISVKINEAVEVENELLKVCGLAVALCGNSSISEFNILPWKDWRMAAWDYILISDNPESPNMVRIPNRPFTSLADYCAYFWSVECMPLLGVVRDGRFGRFDKSIGWLTYFRGGEQTGYFMDGEKTTFTPDSRDLRTAQIAGWPHAKIRIVFDPTKIELPDFLAALDKDNLESYLQDKYTNMYLEFRAPATAPKGEEIATPALALGLVENLAELKTFTAEYSWDEWKALLDHAAVAGMEARVGGRACFELLKPLVDIAKKGLKSRGLDEEKYLEPLYKRIEERKNPADRMNELITRLGNNKFLEQISYF